MAIFIKGIASFKNPTVTSAIYALNEFIDF